MSNRSYFTTPLFVLTALISLYVFVSAENTKAFLETNADNLYHQSSAHTHEHLKLLNAPVPELEPLVEHIETPKVVRAIYVSSWVAGSSGIMAKLIDFIENSSINAVVIDIKDSTGVISFSVSDDGYLSRFGTDSTRIADLSGLIETLHSKNIYVIGRLTTFQDPLLAEKMPAYAFKRNDNGAIWKDRKGLSFIDPSNTDAWKYIGAIAEYSYAKGFDEINFDYIRYPSDGDIKNINYGIEPGSSRRAHMKDFYQYLDKELREEKEIPISADIFGLVTSAQDDIGIGQYLEDIVPYFDFVAPMVYPSHYSSGFFGYANPNENPYEVVKAAMESAHKRIVAMGEDPQKLRTWIQDFSLGVHYGVPEIKAQLKAIGELGLDSYMVWDPKNRYTQEAYKQ